MSATKFHTHINYEQFICQKIIADL
jgi:hypothetical protein